MAKHTTAEELDIAIRLAAREPGPATSREIAERFYDDESKLLAPFISQQRGKARREGNTQMQFAEMLGFSRLPAKIPGAGRKTIPLEEATVGQLRRQRDRLVKKRPLSVQELDRAIELMEKYTKAGSQADGKITWGEVIKREAAARKAQAKEGVVAIRG